MVHRRTTYIFLVVTVIILLGVELTLRTLGFGDSVLVQEDSEYEYIAQPNQERNKFGNRIHYNQFSMRSDNPNPGAVKILGLGDSVLNGGSLTSQEELATNLLSDHLTSQLGKEVQVLNVSYKSWGPDNALAYLRKHGDFQAAIIFLVVSSHDAFDNMTFEKVVGWDKNYPEEQYSLATFEILDVYILPRVSKILQPFKANAGEREINKQEFNSGFAGILRVTKEKNIPLVIYLHPELSEVKKGVYKKEGQLIAEFAKKNNILLLEGLTGAKESHYRDNIHINDHGQQYLFAVLLPVITSILQ